VWWLNETVHEVLKNLGQPLLDGGYSHGRGPTVCTEGYYLSERLLGKVLRSRLVLLQRLDEVVLSIHLRIRSDRSEGIEAACSMREKFLIVDFIH
jgi:hypothetical protein